MDTFERMLKAARAANDNPGLFSAQEMWQRAADAWRLAGAHPPESDTDPQREAGGLTPEEAAEYREIVDMMAADDALCRLGVSEAFRLLKERADEAVNPKDGQGISIDEWDPRPLPDDGRLRRWAAWGGEWLGAVDDGAGHAVWAPLSVDDEDWDGNRDKSAWRPLGPDGPVAWDDFYAHTHPPIPNGWEKAGRWEYDASAIKSGGAHILGGEVGGYTLTAGDGWSVRVGRAASTTPIGDAQEKAPESTTPEGLPPVPDGYETAGGWRLGGSVIQMDSDHVLLSDGTVTHQSCARVVEGVWWQPLRKRYPDVPDGYLAIGRWTFYPDGGDRPIVGEDHYWLMETGDVVLGGGTFPAYARRIMRAPEMPYGYERAGSGWIQVRPGQQLDAIEGGGWLRENGSVQCGTVLLSERAKRPYNYLAVTKVKSGAPIADRAGILKGSSDEGGVPLSDYREMVISIETEIQRLGLEVDEEQTTAEQVCGLLRSLVKPMRVPLPNTPSVPDRYEVVGGWPPSDDTIPAGYLRDGPWERGGTREAGIGGALSGPVFSSGTGWRCCVRREGVLPEGFEWVGKGKGHVLEGPDNGHGVTWAIAMKTCPMVWHGGAHSRAECGGDFPSLEAAKAWCVRTLFPPPDGAGSAQVSPPVQTVKAEGSSDATSLAEEVARLREAAAALTRDIVSLVERMEGR